MCFLFCRFSFHVPFYIFARRPSMEPNHPPSVFDNWSEKMWHTCAAGDAVSSSADPEGGGRDSFLRPRRKLSQGAGMVPEEDASLVPRPDYHREEPQLLRDARGE